MRRAALSDALFAALIAVFMLAGTSASVAQSAPIPVFVEPNTRSDGFVDVDQGILDTIADIQREMAKSKILHLERTRKEQARIVLTVMGRRSPGDQGGVGVPIGGTAVYLPIRRRAIDSVLRFGTYTRQMVSEQEDNDTWRAAAARVVKDVEAWVNANRAMIGG